MNSAEKYVAESLAASGLAVISGPIAASLRPDLWRAGTEAGMDLARLKVANRPGVARYSVQFEGLNRPVEVLARSADRLALRLEWLTGYRATDIDLVELPQGSRPKPAPPAAKPDPSADRYLGVATKEEGRQCGDCEHFTAGRTCMASEVSGIERPHGGTRRRCLGFTPTFQNQDQRNGRQLWPELQSQPTSHSQGECDVR